MNAYDLITTIVAYSHRQGMAVVETARAIKKVLTEQEIPFSTNAFIAETPHGSAEFSVDGVAMLCKASSFLGGEITSKDTLLTSTIPSRFNLEQSNINFNPYAKSISRSNFYFAPAIAIHRNDVQRVINAEVVRGVVTVEKIETEVEHILVGNITDPKIVVFAHYDSIETGCIDNASGVAVSLSILLNNRDILSNVLFVFDPQEELSYDKPTYWGKGFRVFEEKYFDVLKNAQKIVVIDSVGNGKTKVSQDPNDVYLSFPINHIEIFKEKVITLYADIPDLMTVYHSDTDTLDKVTPEFLDDAEIQLHTLVTSFS